MHACSIMYHIDFVGKLLTTGEVSGCTGCSVSRAHFSTHSILIKWTADCRSTVTAILTPYFATQAGTHCTQNTGTHSV